MPECIREYEQKPEREYEQKSEYLAVLLEVLTLKVTACC